MQPRDSLALPGGSGGDFPWAFRICRDPCGLLFLPMADLKGDSLFLPAVIIIVAAGALTLISIVHERTIFSYLLVGKVIFLARRWWEFSLFDQS